MALKLTDRDIIKFDLYFSDGQHITLNKLIDYDIDLYKRENSCIDITSAFNNSELFSRFCNNTDNVIKIYYTMHSTQGKDDESTVTMLCDMYISSLMLNGSVDTASEMRVRLEGMVK